MKRSNARVLGNRKAAAAGGVARATGFVYEVLLQN